MSEEWKDNIRAAIFVAESKGLEGQSRMWKIKNWMENLYGKYFTVISADSNCNLLTAFSYSDHKAYFNYDGKQWIIYKE